MEEGKVLAFSKLELQPLVEPLPCQAGVLLPGEKSFRLPLCLSSPLSPSKCSENGRPTDLSLSPSAFIRPVNCFRKQGLTHGLSCIGHREHGEREGNTVIAGGRGDGGQRRRIVLRTSNFVYCAARPSSESNGPAHGYRLGARLLPRIFSIPECDAKIASATLMAMHDLCKMD